MPTTEICILTTPEGCTFDDPSTEAGKIWQKTIQTVQARKGYQRDFWGRKIEDPRRLIWIIDWDSIEDHAAFINDPSYKDFFATASPIFDLSSPPFLYHVNFTHGSPASAPIAGPVTELASFYLPASASEADRAAFEDKIARLCEVCGSTTDKPSTSFSGGWAVEEFDQAEGKAIMYGLLLAWESLEAHVDVTKTEPFQQGFVPAQAHLLQSAQVPDMAHMKFQKG